MQSVQLGAPWTVSLGHKGAAKRAAIFSTSPITVELHCTACKISSAGPAWSLLQQYQLHKQNSLEGSLTTLAHTGVLILAAPPSDQQCMSDNVGPTCALHACCR
jgi:hypothetical protein